MNISFDMQQEYCIQWNLFQTLNFNHINLINVKLMLSIELILNSFEDEAFNIESSSLIWTFKQSRLIAINLSV